MVRDDEKRSLRPASCCRVEVRKGGYGRPLVRLLLDGLHRELRFEQGFGQPGRLLLVEDDHVRLGGAVGSEFLAGGHPLRRRCASRVASKVLSRSSAGANTPSRLQ